MQNANRNVLVTIVVVLGILILVGAYFLFQGGSALPGSLGAASSTSNILGATTTANGGSVVVSTPTGGNGNFGVSFDTSAHMSVGGAFPTIKVNLPPNSSGKALVFALKPATATSSFATMVIFGYILDTNGTTTQVSGIHLAEYIDGATGKQHVPLPPGQYQLESVLWDRNPFYTDGVYGDNTEGNNATAVLSSTFTISAQ